MSVDRSAALSATGLARRYGAVRALDGVDLTLRPGEVQVLLGENGAGKSTLVGALAGVVRPDAGTIHLAGGLAQLRSPADALRAGIGVLYQHSSLVPGLGALENALLVAGGFFPARREARRFLVDDPTGLIGDIDPDLPVAQLSHGQRQRLEIALVLWRGARVLVLDEPTALLLPEEAEALETAVRGLAERGAAVLWVTHELRQARRIGDRLTVLRAGRVAAALDRAELAALGEVAGDRSILDAMFGSEEPTGTAAESADPTVPGRARLDGAPVLEIRGAEGPGEAGEIAVRGIDLTVSAGEIVGVAGVDGQGQRSLFDAVSGLRRLRSGTVALAGADVTGLGVGPRRRLGLASLSDDRLGEGIAGSLSLTENLTMTTIARPPFWRRGLSQRARMRLATETVISEYAIRPPDPEARAAALSGGNIQKLLLARELSGTTTLLVCHQPSHGLDVRTVDLVHARLRQAAAAGAGILLLSSDLSELLGLCDRVVVLAGGRIATEVVPTGPDAAERIRQAMVVRS